MQSLKWKTKSGEIINVSDMTNDHIQNAVYYLRRQKSLDVRSMEILSDEISKREKKELEKFLEQTQKCPFCEKGVANIKEYDPDNDAMFNKRFVFGCNSCSYTSGLIPCPEQIFKNPPLYRECHHGSRYYNDDFYEQE